MSGIRIVPMLLLMIFLQHPFEPSKKGCAVAQPIIISTLVTKSRTVGLTAFIIATSVTKSLSRPHCFYNCHFKEKQPFLREASPLIYNITEKGELCNSLEWENFFLPKRHPKPDVFSFCFPWYTLLPLSRIRTQACRIERQQSLLK